MTRRPRQRGVALLLALLVVALLAVTVLPFVYDGRVERTVASNLYTALQASHLAGSGVVFAEALLREDARTSAAYDGLDETWAQFNSVPIAAGGGSVAMAITDEAGKLNVNRIVNPNGEPNEEWRSIVVRLLVIRGQQESDARTLTEALIDWIDPDDRPTGFGGAEESYYLGLTPPYKPANASLRTVAELRQVKGWDGKVFQAVAPFLTAYPERGDGKVNFNTAPKEVLEALGLDASQADAVVEYRQKTPLKNPGDIRQVPGLSGSDENLVNRGATRSNVFSVVATGTFRDSTAIVRAVLQRSQRIERIYWRAE